jgi:uncharacterized protein
MNNKKCNPKIVDNRLLKCILLLAGVISLILGIIGIILPLLPTTPFLLLSAACFARSSKKCYNWLMNNKWFGEYIKNYHEGKGIPLKIKIYAISLLWVTILASIIFFIGSLWIRLLLLLIAFFVTIHILKIKTFR